VAVILDENLVMLLLFARVPKNDVGRWGGSCGSEIAVAGHLEQ
jgi:hypothetical protein